MLITFAEKLHFLNLVYLVLYKSQISFNTPMDALHIFGKAMHRYAIVPPDALPMCFAASELGLRRKPYLLIRPTQSLRIQPGSAVSTREVKTTYTAVLLHNCQMLFACLAAATLVRAGFALEPLEQTHTEEDACLLQLNVSVSEAGSCLCMICLRLQISVGL